MNKFFFVFLICVLFSSSCFACKCNFTSVEKSFSASKAVLLIEVQSLKVVREEGNSRKAGQIKYLEARIKTLESFKKANEDISVLTTYSNCGLELYPSQKYLVYVPKEGAVENYASHCHGSFHYLPQLEHSQAQLDEVRKYAYNKAN
ncbi:hypothetical protein [Pseudoalteromonas piscicida]|uniref:hypothetical protein n=1 Tax=Pseudoalteromonas piscicida TaxID=43662 RepID=UPI0005FA468E|nr:hypothetical protein [Pseudoalteromonas piscicida]KJY95181.1 hypothetical protein TW73_17100 [Pseudoalteromonas piscicida]